MHGIGSLGLWVSHVCKPDCRMQRMCGMHGRAPRRSTTASSASSPPSTRAPARWPRCAQPEIVRLYTIKSRPLYAAKTRLLDVTTMYGTCSGQLEWNQARP